MNDERRKRLQTIHDKLIELGEELTSIQQEEQEAFENLPDSLQGGERGAAMEQAADHLDDAVNAMTEVTDAINEAVKK